MLGFTRLNRDPHASCEYGPWVICRIPSLQGTVLLTRLKQTQTMPCAAWGLASLEALKPSWPPSLQTPYSSNHWPVRPSLPTPRPAPSAPSTPSTPSTQHTLLSRPARCPPAAHHLPPRMPSPLTPVSHAIRSSLSLPVPRILGVVKSVRPPSSSTAACAGSSRIIYLIANIGYRPQSPRRNLQIARAQQLPSGLSSM